MSQRMDCPDCDAVLDLQPSRRRERFTFNCLECGCFGCVRFRSDGSVDKDGSLRSFIPRFRVVMSEPDIYQRLTNGVSR